LVVIISIELIIICLGYDLINWTVQLTYLGVCICSGKLLKFDVTVIKQAFFSACNSIYSVAKHNDQMLHLTLQETYCLPVLNYCITAICLNTQQMRTLNYCWNSVFRRIFGFNKWESVSAFICGFCGLDFHHIVSQ
jgi:hypothetical protein